MESSRIVSGQLMQLGLTIADYVVLAFAVGLMLFVSLKSRAGSISMSLNAKPCLSGMLHISLFL